MQRRRRPANPHEFPRPDVDPEQVKREAEREHFFKKFREHHVETVFYYALLGMTEEQMSVAFDITLQTLTDWKNKFPSFLEAMQKGKEYADAKVVHSLYQAAIGYEMQTEQLVVLKRKTFDPTTGKLLYDEQEIVHEPVLKKFPPNVKAGVKWLESRQPAQWSNRKEVNKTITHTSKLDFSGLSLEDLQVLKRLGVHAQPVEDAVFWTDAQKELAMPAQMLDEPEEQPTKRRRAV